jgi:hypothetical protein
MSTHRIRHRAGAYVVLLAFLALPFTLPACTTLGTCTTECTFESDGSKSFHGPYDDYTEAECDDQADLDEAPGITTCVADWESY